MRKILIDLDGVLNMYNGDYNNNSIPPIRLGAKTFLSKISKNFDIYIFTSRNLLLVSKWIFDNDLTDFISDVTSIKIPAWLYIDDRCIQFRGDYNSLLASINDFEVWYHNS